jgi:hypothetical protein
MRPGAAPFVRFFSRIRTAYRSGHQVSPAFSAKKSAAIFCPTTSVSIRAACVTGRKTLAGIASKPLASGGCQAARFIIGPLSLAFQKSRRCTPWGKGTGTGLRECPIGP